MKIHLSFILEIDIVCEKYNLARGVAFYMQLGHLGQARQDIYKLMTSGNWWEKSGRCNFIINFKY